MRARWEPTKNSAICSKHVPVEDFARVYSCVPGMNKPRFPRLKRDDLGVAVFPKIRATRDPTEKSQTERGKEMVRYSHLCIPFISNLKSRILILDFKAAIKETQEDAASILSPAEVMEVGQPLACLMIAKTHSSIDVTP